MPATLSTTARSSPVSLFINELLPTLGLPTSDTRRGPPVSVVSRGVSGSASRILSRRSPVPRPWAADTEYGSPRPSDHSAAASDSIRSSSTLLAASNTGVFERRNTLATASSVVVAPTVASTTSTMASAVFMATSACRATDCAIPLASGSQPPVSCTMNRLPAHDASYETRSRVTPGMSSTTASRRPRMRFTSDDLPTLGRPTMATTGTATADPSSPSSVNSLMSQSDSSRPQTVVADACSVKTVTHAFTSLELSS